MYAFSGWKMKSYYINWEHFIVKSISYAISTRVGRYDMDFTMYFMKL